MSKLVEAAAEFLSRDTSTKQTKNTYDEQILLTAEEFESLTNEDQENYVSQLQELSTGTLIRYRRKAEKQSDKSFMQRRRSLDPNVRNTETDIERKRDAGMRLSDKKLSDRDIDTSYLPQAVRSKTTGKTIKVPGAKTVDKKTTREEGFSYNKTMIEAANKEPEMDDFFHDHLHRSNFHRKKSKDPKLSRMNQIAHGSAAEYHKRAYEHYLHADIQDKGPYRSHLIGAARHEADTARSIEKEKQLDT